MASATSGYRVRLIQMSSNEKYKNVELAGIRDTTQHWAPEGQNFVMKQYKEKMGEREAVVLEFDGNLKAKEDIKMIEPYLTNAGVKTDGELATQHNSVAGLGSLDGTGLMQSIVALKIRELYDATAKKI